jgi:hypothetical protein
MVDTCLFEPEAYAHNLRHRPAVVRCSGAFQRDGMRRNVGDFSREARHDRHREAHTNLAKPLISKFADR